MANKDFTLPANSDLSEQVPEPKNDEVAQPEKIQMIKYVGRGSEKLLTEADFHQAGIRDQKTVRWHNLNGYMIPVDAFSPQALELVLAQPTVTIVEVDADGTQV